MRSLKSLTLCLMLSLSLPLVSSCAKPALALQTFPRVDLLVQEPRPVPTIDTVISAQANQAHQRAKDTWGQAGWDRVKAICVWAKERGMPEAPC